MLMFVLSKGWLSRRFKWMVAVGFLLPALAGAQATGPTGGMPEDLLPELRPILRTALQRAPQMITNDIYVAQAEANRYSSDAALWPGIYGSAGYNVNTASTSSQGASTPSKSSGLSYSFSGSQPIFHWGALKHRSEVGRIAVKIAERQYAEAYRLLVSSLRSQYLTLIAKKAALRYARNTLSQTEKNLLVEEEKLKEGTVSVGDLISPRLNLAEVRLTADRAEADYLSSKRIFVRLAGMSDIADETIPFEVSKPAHSPDAAAELMRIFTKDGPGMTNQGQVYLMTLRQGDLNYRIAKTGLYPKFSAAANYGLSISNSVQPATTAKDSYVLQSEVTSYSYGINMSWAIFDGFATRGAKRAALASKRATERLLQSYAETTVDMVESLHRQLLFSVRALELSEQRYDLAKASVDRSTEDFKLGLASQATVDSTTSSLLGASVIRLYARSDYLTRWADFVSRTGADPVMSNLPARYVRSLK